MKQKKQRPVVVVKDQENPEPDEVIAKAIIEVSAAMKKLDAGPLKRRALVLLIRDATGNRINQTEIHHVLDAMSQLETLYTRKGNPTP